MALSQENPERQERRSFALGVRICDSMTSCENLIETVCRLGLVQERFVHLLALRCLESALHGKLSLAGELDVLIRDGRIV
jgi:hypothetical protein